MEQSRYRHGGAVSTVLILLSFLFNNETLSNNLCLFMNQPCLLVGIGGCALLVFFLLQGYRIPAWQTVLLGFMMLCVVLVQFLDRGTTNGYFLILMNLVLAYAITVFEEPERFRVLFVRFMTVISVYSLVCTYLLKRILLRLPMLFPLVKNSAGYTFIDAHAAYVMKDLSYYRNYGLFREPGVFAVFLCLALLFELTDKTPRRGRTAVCLVLAAGVVSTFSAAGYLAMIFIAAIRFLQDGRIPGRLGIWISVAAAVLMIALCFGITDDNLFANVFRKFSGSNSSMRYRMESVLDGLAISAKHRFLGIGIQNGTRELQMANNLSRYHNTSTVTAMLVYFGLPYLAVSAAGLVRFCRAQFGSLLYLIPIVFLMSSQQFLFNVIFYSLILYGFTGSVRGSREVQYENRMGN